MLSTFAANENYRSMRKFTSSILMPVITLMFLLANDVIWAQVKEADIDTISQKVMTINDKVSGIEERITNAENDLYKMTKIKISGYIQAQWQNYEASSVYPNNFFSVRRARIKFQYEPVNGVVFVLQPDFMPGNITIKDAYAQVNEPWLKTFSLWAGKFNRPNYEVEYSSSNREVPERSRVIRAIYPDERAIGAKLEIHPPKIPLKFQLAVFNGNAGIATPDINGTPVIIQNADFDNHKDLMARLTYAFKLGKFGGLTIGAHGYYGGMKANSTTVLNSNYSYKSTLDNIGKIVPNNWIGFEAQLYMDVLGGLALKGEYITGVNSNIGITTSSSTVTQSQLLKNDTLWLTTTTTKTSTNTPAITRNFSGWYVYLIKNIGKRNQIAVRYDWFNPNTKLSADSIGTNKYSASTTKTTNDITYSGTGTVIASNQQSIVVNNSALKSGTSDVAYGTWTLSYSYFFSDNIKFMVGYEIPMNRKSGYIKADGSSTLTSNYTVNGVTSSYDYTSWVKANVLTVRVQVKF
jgi:hypothetical protein